jgi:hypothetical protein
MLINVPTAEEMEQNALRIYFTAWEHVIKIIDEMLDSEVLSFSVSHGRMRPDQDNAQDIDEYIARSQSDLQIAYTLIQQSQEIALKAKICKVSPFLLLLGTDVRTWPGSVDFTRFRTLDAVDLVRVVNAVSPQSLSNKFINMFESIRGNRNSIYHLGTFADRLDPVALIDILIKQYHELHPNRNWLADRFDFECAKRYGIFYTRHYNETTIILLEVSVLLSILTNTQYQHVLGFSKKQRRYICHFCCAEAELENAGVSPEDIKTATLASGKDAVFCHLCQKEYAAQRVDCVQSGCSGNVISIEEDWLGLCHTCGEAQNAV